MENHTAGSPVDETIRWTNRSPQELAEELVAEGFQISDDTVRRLLTDELELSVRQAVKDEAGKDHPQRNEQFEHIARRRAWYAKKGWPILSIDTRKKELLGDFWRGGTAYTDGQIHVLDHDFVSQGHGRLVPYGVYDVERNEGYLRCRSRPTPARRLATPSNPGGNGWEENTTGMLPACWCSATAAAATGIGSIGSKRNCMISLVTCGVRLRSRITRQAAPNTISSSTGCSATSAGRSAGLFYARWKPPRNSSSEPAQPLDSRSSWKPPNRFIRRDSKPPVSSWTPCQSNSTNSFPNSTTPPFPITHTQKRRSYFSADP